GGDTAATLTLTSTSDYQIVQPDVATVDIADPPPGPLVITITANDPIASEVDLDPAQFTVTRSGDTGQALRVNLAVAGTATRGRAPIRRSRRTSLTVWAARPRPAPITPAWPAAAARLPLRAASCPGTLRSLL